MELRYIMSQEEYNTLLEVQQEPNSKLRKTNTRLAKQCDELKQSKGVQALNNITSPFKVESNILDFTTKRDFVAFFNHTAQKQEISRPSLMKTDQEVFDFLENLCSVWGYELPFKDVKVLKSYRVSLVKSNLYYLTKNNTLVIRGTQ